MNNRKAYLQETPAAGWPHLIDIRNYVWDSLNTPHGPVQAKDNTVLWMDMTRGYQLQQKGEANSVLHKLCDTWRQLLLEKKKEPSVRCYLVFEIVTRTVGGMSKGIILFSALLPVLTNVQCVGKISLPLSLHAVSQ